MSDHPGGGGKSLGYRSGSYGSLQLQQQQQQILHGNGVGGGVSSGILHSSSQQLAGSSVRKAPKMLPNGSREKERFISRICKFLCRRRVGMLILLVLSAAVFCTIFSPVARDEDTSPVIEFTTPIWDSLSHDLVKLELSRPQLSLQNKNKRNATTFAAIYYPSANSSISLIGNISRTELLGHHPCEGFSFLPPPTDRKRTGPRPCPVCYVSTAEAVALMPPTPSFSPILKDLTYVHQEDVAAGEFNGGSLFGGHPSLNQREESFVIKPSMTVHCGFVQGKKPGISSGFDIDEADLREMERCRGVVVASAIFGNYDVMQEPDNISDYSKETVCFFMFLDKETEAAIKNYTTIDDIRRIGIWRVVVVQNLPFTDARRNGKVPKLLLHRLFPNVRFSIWIDGKLKLVRDPYLILERFLWRQNVSFAISRHYRRFDVFEEAEANKAAGKYDNASIDQQIEFYTKEGLTHYSSAKLPITSDVPEGCVIIREHVPITNLFTCLWFNEVDRFTARDQLSFSTVRDKIRSRVNWTADMFLDCERRDFVVQAYHRELLEKRLAASLNTPSPPQPTARQFPRKMGLIDTSADKMKPPSLKKVAVKKVKEKKSSGRRHRTKAPLLGKESPI